MKRDLVADDHTTGLERCVEIDTEVAPLDLARGRESGPGTTVGIRSEASELYLKLHRLVDTLQSELPVDDPVVAVRRDAGGTVRHGWVLLHLEEIGGTQVIVPVGVARVDRVEVDRGGHG